MLEGLEIGKSFSDQAGDLIQIEDFIFEEYENWRKTKCNRKPVNPEVLKEQFSIVNTMKPLIAFVENT